MKPVRAVARTPKQQEEAERRFLARILMGEHPDMAARVVGITSLDAGRLFRDGYRRHLSVIAKAAGASVASAERLLSDRRAAHLTRVAELVSLAVLDEAERTRRPEAPNAHRLAQGDMREGVAKAPDDPRGKAEVRVWVSGKPTALHDCRERGQITARQFEAGQRIEALAWVAHGSGVTRSCLDFTPSGTGGTGAAQAAASADLHAVSVAMGDARDACIGVVVFHQPTGERSPHRRRWARVLAGLDIAGDFFGLPKEDA